jgi:hypothetical protein
MASKIPFDLSKYYNKILNDEPQIVYVFLPKASLLNPQFQQKKFNPFDWFYKVWFNHSFIDLMP